MTALESRAAGRGGNWKRAAAGFAREQVAAHPMTFLRRSAERLRMLWAPEFFPLRHLSQGVYPALPTPVAVLVLLAVVGGHLLFGLAAIAGLLGWKTGPPGGVALSPGLLLLLVLAGSAAPLLTVAIPRLNLPYSRSCCPPPAMGSCSRDTTACHRRGGSCRVAGVRAAERERATADRTTLPDAVRRARRGRRRVGRLTAAAS